jgi:hypothetical protein
VAPAFGYRVQAFALDVLEFVDEFRDVQLWRRVKSATEDLVLARSRGLQWATNLDCGRTSRRLVNDFPKAPNRHDKRFLKPRDLDCLSSMRQTQA